MDKAQKVILGTGLLGIALVSGIILSANRSFRDYDTLRDVTEEEFDSHAGSFNMIYPTEADSVGRAYFGREVFIFDLDEDGQADILSSANWVYWRASDFSEEDLGNRGYITMDARLMTPKIRDVATRVMGADRELSLLVAKENYRLDQEERQNEGNK